MLPLDNWTAFVQQLKNYYIVYHFCGVHSLSESWNTHLTIWQKTFACTCV